MSTKICIQNTANTIKELQEAGHALAWGLVRLELLYTELFWAQFLEN